jgi:hypothetical protein
MGRCYFPDQAPIRCQSTRRHRIIVYLTDMSIGYPTLAVKKLGDQSYIRMLSQKFTTDCSAQNLAGPVLLEINAQWPPWSGAIR